MKHLLPCLALAALIVPAVSADAATPYRVRVGLGAQVEPDFPGADSLEVNPYPEVSVAKGDSLFSVGAPDDSFAIPLFSSSGFSAGPVAALESARYDGDVGAPVGDVKRTIEVGAFAQQMIGENFRVRAEVRNGLGGHDGLIGNVGADYIARDGDNWTLTAGPRVRFGDDDFMNAYYGVTPAVAVLSGLPAYDAGGGLHAIGATTGFTYSLGGPLGLFGYGRYDRLVGDAKDSPIVRQYGSPDQFSAGLGVSYTFNLNL
ncbi:MipA/OmpV family protein [Sphingomonas sabuli]|uniref:MipA/OmpV family protein n=1 Tax=Sphingomonas sabuli TaxID=2764186 RepID=A0A7G9L201_9SPHN|nr:MipA/OmpV family protein [Sphingomonas sabuli]QNM82650.1 MipA/OmpV family protein [Sphingomonas sabuli]